MAAAASEGSDALPDKQSEDEWENVPTAAEKEKTSRAACAHWCRLVQRTMKELETADKAIAQYFAKIAISTSSLPMAASASEGSAVGNRPFTAEADLEIVQVSFLALRSQVLSLGLGLAKAKADNSLAEVKLVEANVALEEAKASIEDAKAEPGSI